MNYVLKQIHQDLLNRNKVKRVMVEQDLLRITYHPFIVKLYHTFQNASHLFLCLEYCAGGEFFRTLQKQPGKRFTEIDARFYAAEVIWYELEFVVADVSK